MNETTTANVTVGFVNQPKAGKKNGTIKTTDDVLFLAKPPILALFQQGGQYKITYDTYSIGGNTFKEIKDVQQVAAAPASQPAGRGGYHQDDGLAERIFVCGAVNSTMGNPNVKPYDLESEAGVRLVQKWRKIWAETFGSKDKEAKPRDDMSDDIPY